MERAVLSMLFHQLVDPRSGKLPEPVHNFIA